MPDPSRLVAITRPEDSAAELARALEARGLRVVRHPTTTIGPAPKPGAVFAVRSKLHDYGWIVLSSVNGVAALLDGVDREIVAKRRFAVVGGKTEQALKDRGGTAQVVATDGRTLADQLVERARNARFLVARGDRADAVLPVALEEAGARVDELVVYSTVASPLAAIEAFERSLLAGEIAVVTFAAGSAVTAMVERIGAERTKACLERAAIAALGKTVVTALAAIGTTPATIAEKSSANALADAAVAALAVRERTAKDRS